MALGEQILVSHLYLYIFHPSPGIQISGFIIIGSEYYPVFQRYENPTYTHRMLLNSTVAPAEEETSIVRVQLKYMKYNLMS